jgi:hypothetical protein
MRLQAKMVDIMSLVSFGLIAAVIMLIAAAAML